MYLDKINCVHLLISLQADGIVEVKQNPLDVGRFDGSNGMWRSRQMVASFRPCNGLRGLRKVYLQYLFSAFFEILCMIS